VGQLATSAIKLASLRLRPGLTGIECFDGRLGWVFVSEIVLLMEKSNDGVVSACGAKSCRMSHDHSYILSKLWRFSL
jgi:hypothetical protein